MTQEKSIKKNLSIKSSSTQFLSQQDLTDSSDLLKTVTHAALINFFSETAPVSELSTFSKQISETTENLQSALFISSEWLIFNKHDDTALKNLSYFHVKKTNIINFEEKLNVIWKHEFENLKILIWKKNKKHTDAVNLYVIDWLSKLNLMTAHSDFESDSVYQLKLTLKWDTVNFIQFILNNDSLKNIDVVHSSVLDCFADFSVKLKKLQTTDILWLDVDNLFFFVWDEKDFWSESLLKMYSVDKLCDTDMLAVETNISFYDFSIRSDLRCAEYSLSLYDVYVFSENISNFSSSTHSSFKNLKHQEDSLVSLKKNKKSSQLAMFSDNEN